MLLPITTEIFGTFEQLIADISFARSLKRFPPMTPEKETSFNLVCLVGQSFCYEGVSSLSVW